MYTQYPCREVCSAPYEAFVLKNLPLYQLKTLLFPLAGAAVIPLTDCCHELLPIQFVIDPGEDFVWGKDDLDPNVIQKLTITTHDKIGLLNEYLDVTKVCAHTSIFT